MSNQDDLKEIVEGTGPGSYLWNLLSSLGVKHKEECPCIITAELMNELGVDGCKREREHLIAIVKRSSKLYGWDEFLKAGILSITTGLIFKIGITDPITGLVDLSIFLAGEHSK